MSRVKQRPLKEVAKEILKRFKEHEEMLIEMTSESAEEKAERLGFMDVDVGMYSNEIERASAELVRHGHWIDRNGAIVAPFWERYECSECGARSDSSKYCHNCGAKMDEEREEE